MGVQRVVIEFHLDRLASYTDQFLAELWHVFQAAGDDATAIEAAPRVRTEIVRRWLNSVPVGLYLYPPPVPHGVARDALRRFAATLVDGAGQEMDMERPESWSERSEAMDRESAVAKVCEKLLAGDGHLLVTRCGELFRIWTLSVRGGGL